MNKNKQSQKSHIIIILIIIGVVAAVKHFHIKNFKTIVPGVLYTCGQPRNMDYDRLLYKYHIATIVNTRPVAEKREQNWHNEEITWIRKNAVNYVEIPLKRENRTSLLPTVRQQKEFLKIMQEKNSLPVLLHGSSGKGRVAMLAAVWLTKAQQYSLDKTIKTVESIKEKHITDIERQFLKSLIEDRDRP